MLETYPASIFRASERVQWPETTSAASTHSIGAGGPPGSMPSRAIRPLFTCDDTTRTVRPSCNVTCDG